MKRWCAVLAAALWLGQTPSEAASPANAPEVIATLKGIRHSQTSCLESAVTQLLAGRGIAVRWEADHASGVAAHPSEADRRIVHLEVKADSANQMTLTFATPPDPTVTIRQASLRDGLSELGCEVVADIVESTVMSLTAGSPPLAPSEPEVNSSPPASADRAAADAPAAEVPLRATSEPWSIAAGLAVLGYGGGFGTGLGPALRVTRGLAPSIAMSLFASGPDSTFSVSTTVGNMSLWEGCLFFQLLVGLQMGSVRPYAIGGVGLRYVYVEAPLASPDAHGAMFLSPAVQLGAGISFRLSERVSAVLEAQGVLAEYEMVLDGRYGAVVSAVRPTLLVIPGLQLEL